MNAKTRMLGMWSTHFADSTGLNPATSPPHDLAKLAAAASTYPLIRQYTASSSVWYATASASCTTSTPTAWYGGSWPILVSKTGYIREAGAAW